MMTALDVNTACGAGLPLGPAGSGMSQTRPPEGVHIRAIAPPFGVLETERTDLPCS